MTAQPTGYEWDLDASYQYVPPSAPSRQRIGPPPALLVAGIVLLVIGLLCGGGLRAAVAPVAVGVGPLPSARLGAVDARLDGTAVAVLRLIVTNRGRLTERPEAITLHGVAGTAAVVERQIGYLTPSVPEQDGTPRITLPLDTSVPPGETESIDLEVRPDCITAGGAPVDAELTLTGGRSVTVLLDGGLDQGGTLCRQLIAALPSGWKAPITVPPSAVREVGGDLHVTFTGLGNNSSIAGIWAGDELIQVRHPNIQPGPDTQQVELIRPQGCLASPTVSRLPTGIRLIVIPKGSALVERYAALGPMFAEWLDHGC